MEKKTNDIMKDASNFEAVDYCSFEMFLVGLKKEIVKANLKLDQLQLDSILSLSEIKDNNFGLLGNSWYAISEIDVELKIHMYVTKDKDNHTVFHVAPVHSGYENVHKKS